MRQRVRTGWGRGDDFWYPSMRSPGPALFERTANAAVTLNTVRGIALP
jgi:hypothetical protein